MSTALAAATPPTTRSPRLMLAGCCLALFIISLDATIVNVALPAIQADLHAILAGFLLLNTLYLQEVRGDSALMAGVATLPVTAVIAGVSPLVGQLIARRGRRLPMIAAGLFLAGGALVLSQDRAGSGYLLLAAGYALLGLGFALINPPITNTAMAGMPAAQAGVASAVATSSRQLGNVLGVAVIGSVAVSQFRARAPPAPAPRPLGRARHGGLRPCRSRGQSRAA